MAPRGVEAQQGERHVHEERHPPRDRVDEDAAHERPEDRERGGRRRPDAERAGPCAPVERRGDDRQGAWDEERARESLDEAREDEDLHRRREPAEDRGQAEPAEADHEDAAPAVLVRERSGEHEERREDREIAARDVGLGLEAAEDAGRQVQRDAGQGHVDDRPVEEDHPRPHDRGHEDPALVRSALLDRSARRRRHRGCPDTIGVWLPLRTSASSWRPRPQPLARRVSSRSTATSDSSASSTRARRTS